MKKTSKKTKKKTVKPVKETYLSYFHSNGKIGLTICSKVIPGSTIHCLGMALTHKEDCGSRVVGKARAVTRCIDGLEEFAKNQEYYWINHPVQPKKGFWGWVCRKFNIGQPVKENLLTEVNLSGVIGQSGHWLVRDLDDVKALFRYLRACELAYSGRKLQDIYHNVFFRLPSVVFSS